MSRDQEVWVDLTDEEWSAGFWLGFSRYREAVRRGRRDRHGLSRDADGIGIHAEGACGEMAVAKWLGKYFLPTMNNFKEADLGAKVQIRTRSNHSWDLIIREDDNDDHVFVLVTGTAPKFCLRGWIYGDEGKQREYLKDYGGRAEAFFVPQSFLRRMVKEDPLL